MNLEDLEDLKAKALKAKEYQASQAKNFWKPTSLELAAAVLELIERDAKWKQGHYEQACELIAAQEKLAIATRTLREIEEWEGGLLQPEASKVHALKSMAREALVKIEAEPIGVELK